jgi:hypothetical protein
MIKWVRRKICSWMLLLLKTRLGQLFFYSYSKGAPGPNGFSFLFYQKMDLIKKDLMGVVKQFEVGALNIERLNYFIIILIPKSKKLLILRKLGQLVC